MSHAAAAIALAIAFRLGASVGMLVVCAAIWTAAHFARPQLRFLLLLAAPILLATEVVVEPADGLSWLGAAVAVVLAILPLRLSLGLSRPSLRILLWPAAGAGLVAALSVAPLSKGVLRSDLGVALVSTTLLGVMVIATASRLSRD